MIKLIIFDLNEVLIKYDPGYPQYKEDLGVDEKEYWKSAKKFYRDYSLGKISEDKFVELTLTDLGLDQTLKEKAKDLQAVNSFMDEEMVEVLDELKDKYKLVLFAGEGKEMLEKKISKFSLDKYFSKVYATCYQGFLKDTPEIYELILKEQCVEASESLFIDDIRKHIDAANKLGINTIHFIDTKQMKDELVSRGLI